MEDCWIADAEAQLLVDALGKNSTLLEFRGANNQCLDKALRKQMRSWAR